MKGKVIRAEFGKFGSLCSPNESPWSPLKCTLDSGHAHQIEKNGQIITA